MKTTEMFAPLRTARDGPIQHETMYYVLRYNLRAEAAAEYGQWLKEQTNGGSEETGWTYAGTFCDVMGLDRYDYETRWAFTGHGSVSTRPLDAETEQRIQDRLPFIEEGQVALMKALNGIVA